MEIRVIDNQSEWDRWLKENSRYDSFTQSCAWGDVLIDEGKKVERLAVMEGEEVLAQAQVVYMPLIFGWQYAFCPGGPILIIINNQDTITKIYNLIAIYLKNRKCIFFRIEPSQLLSTHSPLLTKTIDLNPPATLILDLNKPEKELLQGMHQKARYSINLAGKKGLKIEDKKDFDIFWLLMKQTGGRDKFKLHSREHYMQVLQSPLTNQLTAYFNNQPIACIILVGFGNTCTYLYGASNYEHRNLMAPYLLQWEGIKMAKSVGYKFYDFFGVAPSTRTEQETLNTPPPAPPLKGEGDIASSISTLLLAHTHNFPPPFRGRIEEGVLCGSLSSGDHYVYDPRHQYAGVTRFKLRFGGCPYQKIGTWDLIIDKRRYNIYKFLRRLRRLV